MVLRLTVLFVILVSALLVNLCVGDVQLTTQEAILSVFRPHELPADKSQLAEVIWNIRLPRILIAAVVGAALSVSGYVLQSLSRNQLADPYLTGVSSGSGLAVALAMIAAVDFSFIPFVSFFGGLGSSIMVAASARGPAGLSITRLLLAGVAVSAVCSGLITLLIYLNASLAQTQGLIFWLAGGISGRTWSELVPLSFYTLLGLLAALLMSKQMRLLSLGTESAQSMGLDVTRAQWSLLAAAVLLCGSAVSVSGMVGFVGLICPNIARGLFGRDERMHLVATAVSGMVLVLLADLAARSLASGQELPLGTLLALLGGPFFLFLVSHHKEEN